MAFQDEIRSLLVEMLPEDKREGFLEKSAEMFDKMGKVFADNAKDLAAAKARVRELEAAKQSTNGSPDATEYSKVLRDLEERDRLLEANQKALDELKGKFQATAKERKEFELLAQATKASLEKESKALDNTLREGALRKAVSLLSLKDPSMSEEIFRLLSPSIQISTDDKGERKVFAKLKGEGDIEIDADPEVFVKDWAEKSPLAKAILAAPRNSGGGATGAQGGSIGGPKTTDQLYEEAVAAHNLPLQMALKAKKAAELRQR